MFLMLCLSFCLLPSRQMASNLSQQASAKNKKQQKKNNMKHKKWWVSIKPQAHLGAVTCKLRSLQQSIPGGKSVRLETMYSKCFLNICLVPSVTGYINL